MRMIPQVSRVVTLLVALVTTGCDDNGKIDPDSGPPPDGPVVADQGGEAPADTGPDASPGTTLKVAAIQYLDSDYKAVGTCATVSDSTCAIQTLVKDAVREGAELVITSDYATYGPLGIGSFEPRPVVGDNPATSSKWKDTSVLKKMAKLAAAEKIVLVFMVATTDGVKKHHTTVAVDSAGKVLAWHDKYMLYGIEIQMFEPGDSLDESFFDSPIGKVGLMSTAEAQCVVNGGVVGGDCTQHASNMCKDYFNNKKPDAVAYVTKWFGTSTPMWQALNVMKAIALKDVWLVAANGTKTPYGHGGGIWKPDGTELKVEQPTTPTVIVAEIPVKGAGPDMGVVDSAVDASPIDAAVDVTAVDGATVDSAGTDTSPD